MVTKIEIAKKYAIDCHAETNHTYDGKPYSVHLQMVVDAAMEHVDMIPIESRETVLAACWTHDVIEDCRETYNDVAARLGTKVADIVYALTNEKGKDRQARANLKYYDGIRNVPFARFVKSCDRLANIKYSKDSGSSMLAKYRNENTDFIAHLHCANYNELFMKMYELTGEKIKIPN